MNEHKYTIVNRFECCGNTMITVIMDRGNASVMNERDYNRIIETERKHRREVY